MNMPIKTFFTIDPEIIFEIKITRLLRENQKIKRKEKQEIAPFSGKERENVQDLLDAATDSLCTVNEEGLNLSARTHRAIHHAISSIHLALAYLRRRPL